MAYSAMVGPALNRRTLMTVSGAVSLRAQSDAAAKRGGLTTFIRWGKVMLREIPDNTF